MPGSPQLEGGRGNSKLYVGDDSRWAVPAAQGTTSSQLFMQACPAEAEFGGLPLATGAVAARNGQRRCHGPRELRTPVML